MAVYVVNNFYTIPKRVHGLDGPATADQVAEWFQKWSFGGIPVPLESGSIYFEHDSDAEWLDEEYFEKKAFISWFIWGYSDVCVMDAGYDDLRGNYGYEEGVVFGLREAKNRGYKSRDVSDIAEMLYDANKKDLDEVTKVVENFINKVVD